VTILKNYIRTAAITIALALVGSVAAAEAVSPPGYAKLVERMQQSTILKNECGEPPSVAQLCLRDVDISGRRYNLVQMYYDTESESEGAVHDVTITTLYLDAKQGCYFHFLIDRAPQPIPLDGVVDMVWQREFTMVECAALLLTSQTDLPTAAHTIKSQIRQTEPADQATFNSIVWYAITHMNTGERP